MSRVVIIGASIGGLPAAYEARDSLSKKHKVTVISNVESFHFVPSNPWVAVVQCGSCRAGMGDLPGVFERSGSHCDRSSARGVLFRACI